MKGRGGKNNGHAPAPRRPSFRRRNVFFVSRRKDKLERSINVQEKNLTARGSSNWTRSRGALMVRTLPPIRNLPSSHRLVYRLYQHLLMFAHNILAFCSAFSRRRARCAPAYSNQPNPAPCAVSPTGGRRGGLHLRPPPEPGHARRERPAPAGRRGRYSVVATGRRWRQGGGRRGLLGVFQPPSAGSAGDGRQPRQGDHLADELAPGEQEARGGRRARTAVQGQRRRCGWWCAFAPRVFMMSQPSTKHPMDIVVEVCIMSKKY